VLGNNARKSKFKRFRASQPIRLYVTCKRCILTTYVAKWV